MTNLRDLVEERTKESFDSVRGKGYYYMDCGGRYRQWTNELEGIALHFTEDEEREIKGLITNNLSKEVYRIMQQGCGHARSLEFVTNALARENPNTLIEGYAVSGSIDDVWMIQDYDSTLRDEKIKAPKVYDYLSSLKNSRWTGIEQDISTLMKDFPYQLDLVFSDHTYMHLTFQWLAFRRTAESLAKDGVFLVRSIDQPFDFDRDERMNRGELLEHLKRLNPTYQIFGSNTRDHYNSIALIRRDGDAPFRTGFRIGPIEGNGGQRLIEHTGQIGKESISVDEL